MTFKKSGGFQTLEMRLSGFPRSKSQIRFFQSLEIAQFLGQK